MTSKYSLVFTFPNYEQFALITVSLMQKPLKYKHLRGLISSAHSYSKYRLLKYEGNCAVPSRKEKTIKLEFKSDRKTGLNFFHSLFLLKLLSLKYKCHKCKNKTSQALGFCDSSFTWQWLHWEQNILQNVAILVAKIIMTGRNGAKLTNSCIFQQ